MLKHWQLHSVLFCIFTLYTINAHEPGFSRLLKHAPGKTITSIITEKDAHTWIEKITPATIDNHFYSHDGEGNHGSITLLFLATLLERRDLIEILLAKGANPFKQSKISLRLDKESYEELVLTPVHYAASLRSAFLLECLLRHRAKTHHTNINIADSNGNSPLHYAFQYGSLPAALLLLKNKASLRVRNIHNHTPIQSGIHTYANNKRYSRQRCIEETIHEILKPEYGYLSKEEAKEVYNFAKEYRVKKLGLSAYQLLYALIIHSKSLNLIEKIISKYRIDITQQHVYHSKPEYLYDIILEKRPEMVPFLETLLLEIDNNKQ